MKRIAIVLALVLLLLPNIAHAQQPQSAPDYVVVGPIYPFSDLGNITAVADALYEQAIPFVLLVMPVYQNLDFPAMDRYADALRYAQARGGTAVMHEATVLAREQETVPLEERLRVATAAYADMGLTLAASQVPAADFASSLMLSPDISSEDLQGALRPIAANAWAVGDYAKDHAVAVDRSYEQAPESVFVWNRGFKSAYADTVFSVDRTLQIAVVAFAVILLSVISLGAVINRRKYIARRESGHAERT